MDKSDIKKSDYLQILERIESLVETAFNMSVQLSVCGIYQTIMSESVVAYKMIMDAAWLHRKYAFVGEDNDVDCEYWQNQMKNLSFKVESFYEDKRFNKSVSRWTYITINHPDDELDLFYNKEEERDTTLQIALNNYAFDCIQRMEQRQKVTPDDINKVVEDEINKIKADNLKSDCDNMPDYIYEYASLTHKAIWKVMYALNYLKNTRDIHLIRDYKFEEYAITLINDNQEAIVDAISQISLSIEQLPVIVRQEYVQKMIDDKNEKLYNQYSHELIDSFFDTIIEKKAYKGYHLILKYTNCLPLNYANLGRYLYGMHSGAKHNTAKELLIELCAIAYMKIYGFEETGKQIQINQLPLPSTLNNERSQEYFKKAIDKGYMTLNNGKFNWIGVQDRGKPSQLAYFLGRVFEYQHSANGNIGKHFPEEDLNSLFDQKRLYSLLTQVHDAKRIQKWREKIDELFL